MFLWAFLYIALGFTVVDLESLYQLWIYLGLSCNNSEMYFESYSDRYWFLYRHNKSFCLSFSDQCRPHLRYHSNFRVFSFCSANAYYPMIHHGACWIQKEVCFLSSAFQLVCSQVHTPQFYLVGSRLLSPKFFRSSSASFWVLLLIGFWIFCWSPLSMYTF